MPHWNWAKATADWAGGTSPVRPDASVDAIIVFVEQSDEERALGLCQEIRNCPDTAAPPLLVAIDRYQLPLGNDVRRLPNAHFVLTPIDEKRLRSKLEEMGLDLTSG